MLQYFKLNLNLKYYIKINLVINNFYCLEYIFFFNLEFFF